MAFLDGNERSTDISVAFIRLFKLLVLLLIFPTIAIHDNAAQSAGMTGIGGPPIMYMYEKLQVAKEVVRGTNAVNNVLQVRAQARQSLHVYVANKIYSVGPLLPLPNNACISSAYFHTHYWNTWQAPESIIFGIPYTSFPVPVRALWPSCFLLASTGSPGELHHPWGI